MILRLLATAALGADLWTSLKIVRSESNPILRWLANRVCYNRQGCPCWCWWARLCWFGWWLAVFVAIWKLPWWFAAALLIGEAAVVVWNVHCWRRRR